MKHLKLLLRSLIKNDACVEGGRAYPWWVAVIFFILSTAISIIPTTVSLFTVDAGVSITQASYDSDKGFYESLKALKADGVDLKFYNQNTVENFNEKVDAEGKAILPYAVMEGEWKHLDENGVKIPYTIEEKVISEYKVETKDENGETITTTTVVESTQKTFQLYILDDVSKDEMSNKVNTILQGRNPYIFDEDPDLPKTKNNISFMIFGKETFAYIKYNANKTVTEEGFTPVGQLTGTYRDIASVTSLVELLQDNLTDTVLKTAKFLNEGYNEIKLYNAAIQLSIYLGINAGIVLLMGLILWLMTRGKNNPFRCYKLLETMKISCWTAFTPALLAMIFGFILGSSNSLAGFMFLLMFGIRSMWLAMKNLRPAINK